MKDKDKDILRAIEEDFLEDNPSPTELGSEQELDPTGLKRWEIEFMRRGKFN